MAVNFQRGDVKCRASGRSFTLWLREVLRDVALGANGKTAKKAFSWQSSDVEDAVADEVHDTVAHPRGPDPIHLRKLGLTLIAASVVTGALVIATA